MKLDLGLRECARSLHASVWPHVLRLLRSVEKDPPEVWRIDREGVVYKPERRIVLKAKAPE